MTNWGRVYYTNAMAMVPLGLTFFALGEHSQLSQLTWGFEVRELGGARVVPLGGCVGHSMSSGTQRLQSSNPPSTLLPTWLPTLCRPEAP